MSAICPNNRHKRVDASGELRPEGFTLLELIVVLLLVSVVTVMAMPNLQRLYGSVARTTERRAILNHLANLGRQALLQRRAYFVVGSDAPDEADEIRRASTVPRSDDEESASFEHHEPYRPDLPDGWTLDLPVPILIRANGVCLGGEVALSYNGEPDVRLVLEPPYCHVAPDA